MRTSEQFSLIPFSREAQPSAFAQRRAGTTLVELLAVITVAAVMLGLSVTTIHLLLKTEHEATRSVRYAASLARLAQRVRDDVHGARGADYPAIDAGEAELLVIDAGGGRLVRYELEGQRATRLEIAAEGPPHRDVFNFPPGSRLSFARPGTIGLVRLEIEMATGRPGQAVGAPPRRLSIEAALSPLRSFEMNPDDGEPVADERTGRAGAVPNEKESSNG
jgi:hypothetical protein